jgi:RNA polymerase sigma-70 factor (sigma-E family)
MPGVCLVRSAKPKGNRVSSFDDFVVARGHELTKFAHLLSHDRADAEDLVQDTLASAFASWKRIERTESPEAYVRRMMVNRNITLWRRHRNRTEPRQDLPEAPSPDTTSSTDLAQALRGIVRALPPKQRAAVVLRYYADYPDAEIADALGCSQATVRSQISRALMTLRDTAAGGEIDSSDLAIVDSARARERTAL